MNTKALRTLEYDKIIQTLAEKAISPMGKAACAELLPSDDLCDIELWQTETSEAVSMILRKGSLPLGGVKDIGVFVKRAEMGGMLTIEDLLAIGDFLYVSRKMKKYGTEDNKDDAYPMLSPQFSQVLVMNELERELNRCILGPTEMADDASPALLTVRRGIKTSNERIKEHLNGVIHSQTYKTMLQDSVITIRNDRYCVPVKAEYKGSFPGMVHDQSSSGATLFIEPMSVVQLNNKIKELLAQERVEMDKVLMKLSGMAAEHADGLFMNLDIFTHLDFVFAKGELSVAMNGTRPIFNEKGAIHIKKGRHPLLNPQSVVPIDIYLGKGFKTLLITGPNTGGKTVSLKTLGLFSLMGQAGLHIPAFDNSELTVFDDVFADIGDEQSIEQSLSTFSSHMKNIVSILGAATGRSLVLMDELGAGTDPTEGAALAVAILQNLHQRGISAAVTTHYSELKVYALTTEGVENACCEFDVATLRPTYKLLIGIPGKSNAFAISEKLGLPAHIISEAKEVLSHEDARFEDVITDLEISKKTVLIEQDRAEAYRREAEKMKTELDAQKQKLNTQREKILQAAKDEAAELLRKTKDEADALFKQMQKDLRQSSQKGAEAARQTLREKLSDAEEAAYEAKKPSRAIRDVPKDLRKGDRVYIHSLNQTGIVSSPPDANGEVGVTAGIMKIKVNLSDLSIDDSEETVLVNRRSVSHSVKARKSLSIAPELDLRGMMISEALEAADKYLDDAYLSSMSNVTLIHGKGTGALRTAITNHLKKHPQVKSHRLGAYGEGESGVTVVELKK